MPADGKEDAERPTRPIQPCPWKATCRIPCRSSAELDLSRTVCPISLEPLIGLAEASVLPFFVVAATESSSSSPPAPLSGVGQDEDAQETEGERKYRHYYDARSFMPAFTAEDTPEPLSRGRILRVDYFVLFRGETNADWFGDYRRGRPSSPPELILLQKALTSDNVYDALLGVAAIGKAYAVGVEELFGRWRDGDGDGEALRAERSPGKAASIGRYVHSRISEDYLACGEMARIRVAQRAPGDIALRGGIVVEDYHKAIDLHACMLISNQIKTSHYPSPTMISSVGTTSNDNSSNVCVGEEEKRQGRGNLLVTPHFHEFAAGLRIYRQVAEHSEAMETGAVCASLGKRRKKRRRKRKRTLSSGKDSMTSELRRDTEGQGGNYVDCTPCAHSVDSVPSDNASVAGLLKLQKRRRKRRRKEVENLNASSGGAEKRLRKGTQGGETSRIRRLDN